MEPLEPLGQVVEQRALGLDEPRELVDQPLGVVAGVGVRAFGEEHPDEGSRSLALGGRGEGRGGDLVGREPGVGGAAQHLGDDPGQRLGAAPLRRSLGDVGARPVSTRDVARRRPNDDRPRGWCWGSLAVPHQARGRAADESRAAADRSRSGRPAASRSGSRSGRPSRARHRAPRRSSRSTLGRSLDRPYGRLVQTSSRPGLGQL